MTEKSDFLMLLSALSLVIISTVSFQINNSNTPSFDDSLRWEVVNNLNNTEIYLSGSKSDSVIGGDIFLSFNENEFNNTNVKVGEHFTDIIQIVWNNDKKQYSFIINPETSVELDPTKPFLTVENGIKVSVLPKSLVYVKKVGGVYPKIK